MAVPGRTTRVSTVVAVLCIVIYIVAIAFGAIQIIRNIGERRDRAEREFQDLTDRASSSAVFLGFMSEAYQETIRDFLTASNTLLGIIITGSNAEYAFERYPGSGIVWVGNSPRLREGSGLAYPASIPPFLNIQGQRNVTIQAVYNTIDNQYLLWVLRNTLLAILIALAIAFVTLLFELAGKSKTVYSRPVSGPAAPQEPKPVPRPVVLKKPAPPSRPAAPQEPLPVIEPIVMEEPVPVPLPEETEEYNYDEDLSEDRYEEHSEERSIEDLPDDPFPEFSIPAAEEEAEDEQALPDFSPDFSPDSFEDSPEDLTPDLPPVTPAEEKTEEKPETNCPPCPPEEGPQGLYTSRSNVGWESYTRDRLASEIHRCASFEQDLTFLIMEFMIDEEISDDLYRQFAGEAINFFAMRDLIFEKGNRGLSIILPNSHLEQGMGKAEEFKNRILAKLPESPENRNAFFAGMSSRSGRLVEAERLMMEASSALNKAKADPVSPIIAFKSDPEKYRDFIKGNTGR